MHRKSEYVSQCQFICNKYVNIDIAVLCVVRLSIGTLSFLSNDCETSTVDAKIIRDRGGLSKGYGFVDMRNDDVGEEQTKELLRRKFLYLRSQKIVFKPAYRKSHSSQVIDILSLVCYSFVKVSLATAFLW